MRKKFSLPFSFFVLPHAASCRELPRRSVSCLICLRPAAWTAFRMFLSRARGARRTVATRGHGKRRMKLDTLDGALVNRIWNVKSNTCCHVKLTTVGGAWMNRISGVESKPSCREWIASREWNRISGAWMHQVSRLLLLLSKPVFPCFLAVRIAAT